MAISFVETCVFDGTQATRGTRDTRNSRVQRRYLIQGLDDTVGSYRVAMDWCQANINSFDPMEMLPRQKITLVKLRGDKAMVIVDYYRTPGMPDFDNSNALKNAQLSLGRDSVQWYSTHRWYAAGNYPSTAFALTSHGRTHHPVEIAVFTAAMHYYAGSPFTAAVQGMWNTVNSAMFSLSGTDWPQFKVRFDTPSMQVERLGGFVIHTVHWQFSVRKDGWWQERTPGNTIQPQLMYGTSFFDIPLV